MLKKTALFSGDGFPYFLRTFSVLCCTFFVFFHHFSRTFFLFSHILCKIFLKKSNVQFFLLARAIHSEHFLLHCLKKEIATAEELDLRQVGKVLIFRYGRQGLAGSLGQGYSQAGTFWCVLNVSLHASGGQLGSDIVDRGKA